MTQADKSSEAPMPKPSAKTPSWVKAVLGLSLAFNLAVLGVIGGAMMRSDKGGDRAKLMQARDFGFAPYISALDEDERRNLGRDFIKKSGGVRMARDEVRQSFAQILQSLRAEPFDAASFETLLTSQQEKLAQRQGLGAQLIAEKVAQMPEAARMEFADRLEANLRRGPRGKPGPKGAPKSN